MVKTNAMRILEKQGADYSVHSYDGGALSGTEVARVLGEQEDRVFKTLVTTAAPGRYYVFVIPVAAELDLKKAAAAAGEKSLDMLPQKQLLPVTGYVHGGCSPVGMKKRFRTFIDESAQSYEEIYVSAGRVGHQMRLSPQSLATFVGARFAPLASGEQE